MNSENNNQPNLWITLHRLKVLIGEYHDIVADIELLHSERLDLNVCVECFQPWPCRTLRAMEINHTGSTP